VAQIVVERDGTGRTQNWAPVRPLHPGAPKSTQSVRLIGRQGDHLIGEAA
jgi:hypothetical protein